MTASGCGEEGFVDNLTLHLADTSSSPSNSQLSFTANTLSQELLSVVNTTRQNYLTRYENDTSQDLIHEFRKDIEDYNNRKNLRQPILSPHSFIVRNLPIHPLAQDHAQKASEKNLENYLKETNEPNRIFLPPNQNLGFVGHCHYVNHNGCVNPYSEMTLNDELRKQGHEFSLKENLFSTTEQTYTHADVKSAARKIIEAFLRSSRGHKENLLWLGHQALGVGVAMGRDRSGRDVIVVSIEFVCPEPKISSSSAISFCDVPTMTTEKGKTKGTLQELLP
ncbi:MAG: hypothetical protein HY390_01320 [Deltaproteobacteria bacterium]|nr:hypothetical protein [Deltaproteobacteria bacterium]